MSETEQNQPVDETPALPQAEQPAPAPEAEAPVPESADGPVVVEPETPDAEPASETPMDIGALEALLFSTRSPLTAQRLAELMEIPSVKPLKKAIKALNEQYEATGRCFRVEQVAGGFQMLTLPQYGPHLDKLYKKDADAKLTKSALESLAIIAYKQPVLRAQVEAIRGVACGETIRSLMEKHLVRIAGRAEEPGRPILYGTTKRFLEVFGLNTLKDLPQSQQLTPKNNAPAPGAPIGGNEPANPENPPAAKENTPEEKPAQPNEPVSADEDTGGTPTPQAENADGAPAESPSTPQ